MLIEQSFRFQIQEQTLHNNQSVHIVSLPNEEFKLNLSLQINRFILKQKR